jgi:hypothetical protein
MTDRTYNPESPKYITVDIYHSEKGQGMSTIKCECGEETEVYNWSFAGGGKRCDGCRRVIGRYSFAMGREDLKWYAQKWLEHKARGEMK